MKPTVHLAYHICPLGGWQYNIETLKPYLHRFTGEKVIGLAMAHRVAAVPVIKEIQKVLGSDTRIIKVKNDPINREAVTFKPIMNELASLIDPKHSVIWYGHTKGVTHTHRKNHNATRLWANACYYYTLSSPYFDKGLAALKTQAITGAFRRYGYQRNFPKQTWQWHYSGTYFMLNAAKFFNSEWQKKIPVHRYAIEALPGILFNEDEGFCSFGEKAGDLYNLKYWKQTLDSSQLDLLMK